MHALKRLGLVGSMGRVGAAGHDAAMENVFALLQHNVLDRRSSTTRQDLWIAIVTWIEGCSSTSTSPTTMWSGAI